MPEEVNSNMEAETTEKEFDELIRRAFEQIAEDEYQEFLKQEKKWKKNPPFQFSKEHERKMNQMFKDFAKGIDIQAKYGKNYGLCKKNCVN